MSERAKVTESGGSPMVDVTLRIDRRNLAELTREKVCATAVWLEDNGDGTFALCATVPLGDEAARGLPNHHPGSKLARLTDEQRRDLANRWNPDLWDSAISQALSWLRDDGFDRMPSGDVS